jgi:hypothetical protein
VFRSLISTVRLRHLAAPAVVYAPLAVAMFGGSAGSLAAVSRSCAGLTPLDMRGWWSVRDAQAMLAACGPDGRAAYLHQQLLDLAYPAALAALLLVATALLVHPWGAPWWPILLPTLAMTVLDYVENIGVWTLLLDGADTHPAMLTVAAAATATKRVMGFVAFTIPLLLILARTVSAIHRRLPRSTPPANPSADSEAAHRPHPPHRDSGSSGCGRSAPCGSARSPEPGVHVGGLDAAETSASGSGVADRIEDHMRERGPLDLPRFADWCDDWRCAAVVGHMRLTPHPEFSSRGPGRAPRALAGGRRRCTRCRFLPLSIATGRPRGAETAARSRTGAGLPADCVG